jgi:DNA-directed RNA polymerase subunit RPC12/RpoP
MVCSRCSSEMVPDDDFINRVRVLVCSNPTCLNRIYPDYPARKSNEDICYMCGKVFSVRSSAPSVLCPSCRKRAQQQKRSEILVSREDMGQTEADRPIRIYNTRRRQPQRPSFSKPAKPVLANP